MYQVCMTAEGPRVLVREEDLVQRKAVYGVVIHDGHILLMRSKVNNKFWYPGGGIDAGESPEEALKRELLEETGVEIEIQKKLLETRNAFYSRTPPTGYLQEAIYYLCSADKNPEKLAEHEVEDVESTDPAWYAISDLKDDEFVDYGYQVLEFYKNQA